MPTTTATTQPPYTGRLFTVPETATILRISRATAYELVRKDQIPTVMIGSRMRVQGRWLDETVGVLAALGDA